MPFRPPRPGPRVGAAASIHACRHRCADAGALALRLNYRTATGLRGFAALCDAGLGLPALRCFLARVPPLLVVALVPAPIAAAFGRAVAGAVAAPAVASGPSGAASRGNGPSDISPLNVHVTVATPNTIPKIQCHRFWPR